MPTTNASKIAAILYTVRDHAATPAAATRTLKRLRRIGYENVQVSGAPFTAIDAAEFRKMADDSGLRVTSAHVGFDEMQADLPRVIDRVQAWGCSYVAIPGFHADPNRIPQWLRFAGACNQLGKKLRKEGIRLQYHNHHFEFEKLGIRGGRGGETIHERLMNATNPDYLQAELDLGWVARGAYDPAAYVRTLAGRVDQVHAKDWGIVGGAETWRAIGEGGLNWPAIVKAGRAAGVKMYIVEQDTCPVTNDPFRSLAISFDNLMQLSL